jgi:hypothetical protein
VQQPLSKQRQGPVLLLLRETSGIVQQPLSKQRQGPVLLLLLQLESRVVVSLLAVAAVAVNP